MKIRIFIGLFILISYLNWMLHQDNIADMILASILWISLSLYLIISGFRHGGENNESKKKIE